VVVNVVALIYIPLGNEITWYIKKKTKISTIKNIRTKNIINSKINMM